MGPDGAPLRGYVALHPGTHPGIVVVHGFNTNGKESIIRWAAMLYANGYNVIASDQRDFKDEFNNGEGYKQPLSEAWLQTFGWKEAQDAIGAAQFLRNLNVPGVTVGPLGILGFSEGAQNTILAMANDSNHLFSAGITFSPPADQNWQIYSTAAPPGCQPPNCTYPATDTLVNLVVPPYGNGGKYFDPCAVLADASTRYSTTPAGILGQEKAYKVQPQITAPLLNFYSADDSLVLPAQATMLAGYEAGNQLQRTILVNRGEHAYFFDRWWQQKAILDYFEKMLGGQIGVPTVNQTPAGAAMSTQSSIVTATPAQSDTMSASAPLVCGTGSPTAVVARSFTAARVAHSLVLRWRTAGETGIAGFELDRGTARLNPRLIVAGGTALGRAYVFRTRPAPGLYRLVVVRLDGTRTVAATTRAT
jgi:hypothetical protein